MIKTFYIQTNEINKVTDIIEYPYQDYKEIELNTPLPIGVLGGAYKLVNGSVVYFPEWDTNELVNKIDILEKEKEELKIKTDILQNSIDEILSQK